MHQKSLYASTDLESIIDKGKHRVLHSFHTKGRHRYPFAKQGCETERALERAKAAEIRKNRDEIANSDRGLGGEPREKKPGGPAIQMPAKLRQRCKGILQFDASLTLLSIHWHPSRIQMTCKMDKNISKPTGTCPERHPQ